MGRSFLGNDMRDVTPWLTLLVLVSGQAIDEVAGRLGGDLGDGVRAGPNRSTASNLTAAPGLHLFSAAGDLGDGVRAGPDNGATNPPCKKCPS